MRKKPVHPKVTSVGLAGALATLILFVAGLLHVEITQGVAAAAATVATFLAGYLR